MKEDILRRFGFDVEEDVLKKYLFDIVIGPAMDEYAEKKNTEDHRMGDTKISRVTKIKETKRGGMGLGSLDG